MYNKYSSEEVIFEMRKNECVTKYDSNLIAYEIRLYLEQLELLSLIIDEKKGDTKNYSSLSFGTPSNVKYEIMADGSIKVDLDFSSVAWTWNEDKNTKIDVNLDYEKNKPIDLWTWMRVKGNGFIRKINKDVVDFDEVKDILKEKYGIECNFSYDEKTYSLTHTNGSDDMISSMRCVYYKVDSKLSLFRKNKYLNNNQVIEPEEVAKTYCLK